MKQNKEIKELEKLLESAIKAARKNQPHPPAGRKPGGRKWGAALRWALAAALVFFALFYVLAQREQTTVVSLDAARAALAQTQRAEIFWDEITLYLQGGSRLVTFASEAAVAEIGEKIPLHSQNYRVLWLLAAGLLAVILLQKWRNKAATGGAEIGDELSQWQQEQQNGEKRGKSGQKIAAENVYFNAPQNVAFSDVLGAHAAKAELRKIIAQMAADRPLKALLFEGASGVGKTMLARAVASSVHCGFFYASASSFNELFVGMGAKRVRELFAAARAAAPCVIFIDEIDALGTARGSLLNKESEHTLNELLVQMDGFAATPGVLLIAATNRADVLDGALLRRFSKRIVFKLPNEREREEFVRAYGLVPALGQKQAVALTAGFSGADFAAVAEEIAAQQWLKKREDCGDLSGAAGATGGAEIGDISAHAAAAGASEKQVLAAIAARRFGLAAAQEYSAADGTSQAAIWTVAELHGAEVYHTAGRVIWQLDAPQTLSRARSEAVINLSAQAACRLILGDEFASNLGLEKAAAAALAAFGGGASSLRAEAEFGEQMADARAAAEEFVALRRELIEARAATLAAEAAEFSAES